MDWIPAISTSLLLGIAAFLSRNIFITRLTNSVKHEYDGKIENIKTDLRKSEEILRAELRNKESQIEALRSNVLAAFHDRKAVVFERELEAIDKLWASFIDLSAAKGISATMASIKFESALAEAANNPMVRQMFSGFEAYDLNSFNSMEAWKCRPYVSEISWAYFSAYQAIITFSIARMKILTSGLNMPELLDSTHVVNLAKAALPQASSLIEEQGVSSLHYLLEELENNLLLSLRESIQRDASDPDTFSKASNIIKQSEAVMGQMNFDENA